MSRVNVRVELRVPPHASQADKKRSGENLLKAFKRACNEVGIMHELREREFYQKPCEKRRRKNRKPKDFKFNQNNKDREERGY